jgi:hypothetical protein
VKNKKLIGIAAVVVILAGIFFLRHHYKVSAVIGANPVLKSEYEKMKSSNDPSVVRRVIMVLKDQGAPEALSESLARATDTDPDMRAAMAEVLCTFPFEGNIKGALEKLIHDKDERVRLRTIQFLGQKSDGERLEFLETFCKNGAQSKAETEMCAYGRFRLAKTPQDQKAVLDSVLGTLMPDSLGLEMISNLIGMAPTDPRVVSLFTKRLHEAKEGMSPEQEKIMERIFRHLAVYAPETVRDEFSLWVSHPVASIRMAALSMVFHFCPKDRWEVLGKAIVSEKADAETKRNIMNAARMLGGRRAFELAKTAKVETPQIDPSHMPEEDSCDVKAKNAVNPHGMPMRSAPAAASLGAIQPEAPAAPAAVQPRGRKINKSRR